MRRTRRIAIALSMMMTAALLSAAMPAAARATAAQSASKDAVKSHRDTSPAAPALGLVKKITVAGDRAVITYWAPDEKRLREVVVNYAELVSAVLWSSGGTPIGMLMMTLMSMSMAFRLKRFAGYHTAQASQISRHQVPPADR